ncbi:MAG TPA: nucleoside deaminase [Saprospiraceae bacterium]|nr:nucleoside deaminase [Saprospiraceae bacterium]
MKLSLPILVAFGSGIILSLLLIYCFPFQYKLHKHFDLNPYRIQLQTLAHKSIETRDVPISSLIIYDNKIIAEGYNTVYRDTNPAGHAEINAINNCIKKYGFKQFNSLERDKLVLISTFEPCEMCKGAMEEYNIKLCVFDLAKQLTYKYKELKKELWLETKMRESGDGRLQYELFKLHPEFDSTKYLY